MKHADEAAGDQLDRKYTEAKATIVLASKGLVDEHTAEEGVSRCFDSTETRLIGQGQLVSEIAPRYRQCKGPRARLGIPGDARCRRPEVSRDSCTKWLELMQSRNLTKEWNNKYETLTSMVVPRSTQCVHSSLAFAFPLTGVQRIGHGRRV
jgi:hypothetical protein